MKRNKSTQPFKYNEFLNKKKNHYLLKKMKVKIN